MAKKKPIVTDPEAMQDAFAAVANEKLAGKKHAATLKRMARNGPLMRHAARRALAQYAAAGGDVNDPQAFLEWLTQNWDSILKMILAVIALFA